ncbi:tyrosyl-DNA phosphodiesterase 1-like [Patiria miniata]|uniref:PBZ-type domain-containing protein n=1 Tax=Patiria miniata TaxID=46514 RepID=A0A913Z2J6_PATMI|nr:tyrosyl-DNA phosphodiesterase 1-like [Patiria miniata]XP_038045919.1 tyrosyl-DNA phosphodiesterase 1-like [Patiria miniata]XP_038045927.1 tyrosyl-DNA phosphodiesterase 1-like [Patiria miniata]
MSDTDSDTTYIEEDETENVNRLDLPESPSNQSAASAEVSVTLKRSATGHDISDSDSETSEGPSQLLLGRSKGKASVSKANNRTPGDLSENQTDSDKPKCQYGAKCYRKNISHRKEFRHSDEDEEGMPPTKRLKRDDTASSSASTVTSASKKKNCLELLREASPLCFLLTKVTGIPDKYNNSLAVHISEILSPCMGDLIASAQFNYMFDIPWLVQQYPGQFRTKPLLIVHGEQRQSKVALHEAAHPYPNIKLCQAKLDIMYGTHHSKMMLLLYTNGMRVVIHTANMIDRDWYQKTQGVWISPLFPKAGPGTVTDSPTSFQRDLVEYLTAYRSPSLQEWIGHVRTHDMSQAKVHIVGSVPGRHIGGAINKWGHLKLRKVLKERGPSEANVKGWPVIGQFSSVGSLGPDKDKWLCGEWLQSLSQCEGSGRKMQGESGHKTLKLIFPSKDNVRTSLEGYPAGGSIPYSIKTAKKQVYFHSFLHQWIANTRGRSRASPHIKTYCRMSPDNEHIAWFLVTSANMSKAAWGALEKNGQQLMIRSYEIGVLFLPADFVSESTRFAVSSAVDEDELHFPLPWDSQLVPYSKDDRPWLWDIPYTDLPDSHGNCWVPPS